MNAIYGANYIVTTTRTVCQNTLNMPYLKINLMWKRRFLLSHNSKKVVAIWVFGAESSEAWLYSMPLLSLIYFKRFDESKLKMSA
jgi:hypothetical protein